MGPQELWKGFLRITRKKGDDWTIKLPRALGKRFSSIAEGRNAIGAFVFIESLPGGEEFDHHRIIVIYVGTRKLVN